MKNWMAPAVEELNVALTANGFFSCDKEKCIWTHPGKNEDNNTTEEENSKTQES